MRRTHRQMHRLMWLLLVPALALGVFAALSVRPDAAIERMPPDLPSQRTE